MLRLSLEEYFEKLQREHDHTPRCLIRAWEDEEVAAVKAEIKRAVRAANFIGETIPSDNLTNQAIGNASENFFVDQVNPHLNNAIVSPARCGGGYPDRLLCVNGKRYCMELKATSSWDDRDSNRRVLTSSPDRLLNLIENNDVDKCPAHLVGTVLYDKEKRTVTKFRVDFIGPDTEVNVRIEASTTQKMLSQDSHEFFTIPY